jgi:hypothetical protein
MKLGRKESATIQAILVFYIISHPLTYRLTNSVLGGLASSSGCPTSLGLIVHSLVFGAVVYGLMYL